MKDLKKQLVVMFISSSLLASCATTDTDSELGPDVDYSGSDCISIRTIRDYTPLDRSSLLIVGGGKRNYLVTLISPSFELRSSFRLSFSSRDSWLCPYGGDRIVFGGLAHFESGIRSISRLTPEQTEDLLIRYGKIEAPEQKDAAPPDLKGADVEELG